MSLDPQHQEVIDADEAEYRHQSASLKMKNILLQGIGSATVFGIIAAATKGLLDVAVVNGSLALLPCLGIAGLAAVGIGCIFFGARYFAESVRLDNYQQAKKINAGKGIDSPAIEQQPKISPISPDKAVETDKAPNAASAHGVDKEWGWISAEPGPINAGTKEKNLTVSSFYSDKAPDASPEIGVSGRTDGKLWADVVPAPRETGPVAATVVGQKPTDSWVAQTAINDNDLATANAVRS